MVDHLWDSTILGCHKEGVYADESVVAIARSPGQHEFFQIYDLRVSVVLGALFLKSPPVD